LTELVLGTRRAAGRRHFEATGEIVDRVGDALGDGEVQRIDGGHAELVAHRAAPVAEAVVDEDLEIRPAGWVAG
jgi:hypothetical protein